MIRYGSTAHWFARRLLYSLCAALLAGVVMSVTAVTYHHYTGQEVVDVQQAD
ncbi:hypothetical protein [Haloechinothrix salitolerans]|uniref:Uncharacterized protein n=1 Tax=Haloechinothrix salitolerans TaxID=926830 RepID=A0ABW2BWX5_9PSEU